MEMEPDLGEELKRCAPPAIEAFVKISGFWNLSLDEEEGVLGGYSPREPETLSAEALVRMGMVIAIFGHLNHLFPEQRLANEWTRLPNTNPLFDGREPLDLMKSENIEDLIEFAGYCRRGSPAVEDSEPTALDFEMRSTQTAK